MSATSSARRSRTREKSNILYSAPPAGDFEGGIRRVNQQDTSLGLIHEVEPSEVRSVGDETDFTEPLPDLPIPASGDPYADCGEDQPLKFCDRCGKPKWIARRCRRAACPECWESWDGKATVEIASKINGRQRYENTGPGANTWMHHVIISPPPEGYRMRSGQPLDQSFEVVKLILGEGGAFEGAIIYHPWRIKPEYRGEVLGHDSGGQGNLQWKHIIHMVEIAGWEAVRDEFLVFSPHFHAFCLSEYFHLDTTRLQKKSGWVVHRVEDDDGASIRELPDLCAAVAYSLSHAGGRPGENRYRYFGETANFEPTPGIKADAKSALAAVSERVLGTGVGGTGRCGETLAELVEANDGEPLNAPPAPTGSPPPSVEIEAEGERDVCGGRDRPMGDAPEYLKDDEWRRGAPFAADLSSAHTEYIAIEASGKGPPPPPA